MTGAGSKAPGWYPDPDGSGQMRWWTGQEWSRPPTPSNSPGPSRRLGLLAIIALIVAAVVGGILALSGHHPVSKVASQACADDVRALRMLRTMPELELTPPGAHNFVTDGPVAVKGNHIAIASHDANLDHRDTSAVELPWVRAQVLRRGWTLATGPGAGPDYYERTIDGIPFELHLEASDTVDIEITITGGSKHACGPVG